MSLIVEDGTGLANSESYDSVANADAYAAAFGRIDWAALATPEAKEVRLRLATQFIDTMWDYPGVVLSEDQALAFPRMNIWVGGVLQKPLPLKVRRACVELATYPGLPRLLPEERVSNILRESKELEGLKKSVTYRDRVQLPHYRVAERLLSELTRGSLSSGLSVGHLLPC